MSHVHVLSYALVFAAVLPMAAANAAPGELDAGFGDSGAGYTVEAFASSASAEDLVVQSSGAIITAGTTTIRGFVYPILARYTSTGALDASFGAGGFAVPSTVNGGMVDSSAVAIDRDNLYQVIPAPDQEVLYVYGWNADGTPNFGFGVGAFVAVPIGAGVSSVVDIAVQGTRLIIASSGKNPATGDIDGVLVALDFSGRLDPTFATGGIAYASVALGAGSVDRYTGLAIQPDGRIVAAGRSRDPGGDYDFLVSRFLPNGTPDPGFGASGHRRFSFGYENEFGRRAVIDSGGRVTVAGSVCKVEPTTGAERCFIGAARLKPDGNLDGDFGIGGRRVTDLNQNMVVLDIGLDRGERAVVSGQALLDGVNSRAFLARYDGRGMLDASFGSGGVSEVGYGSASNYASAVMRYASGTLVTAGSSFVVVDPLVPTFRKVMNVARFFE